MGFVGFGGGGGGARPLASFNPITYPITSAITSNIAEIAMAILGFKPMYIVTSDVSVLVMNTGIVVVAKIVVG